MISVFVMGLLPDFFAIANSSEKLCAAVPPPRYGARHELPKASVIRGSGNEIATRNPEFLPKKHGGTPAQPPPRVENPVGCCPDATGRKMKQGVVIRFASGLR
jgi:hypothetical protein